MTVDVTNNSEGNNNNIRLRYSKSSILNEILESSSSGRQQKADIKTRADHLVNSTINLIEDIRGEFGDEIAEKLERRLFAAIKNRDPSKFRFNRR